METGMRTVARALSSLPLLVIGIVALSSQRAVADEGGVSFWLPGTYGSLAAVPGQPGWSFATFNYYDSVSAQKGVDFVRGGGVQAGLSSRGDFLFVAPSYVFATPVLGGQASVSMGGFFGNDASSVFGTLAGPGGKAISGSRSDSVTGFGGELRAFHNLDADWGGSFAPSTRHFL